MNMIKAATAVLGHDDFTIVGDDQIALNSFLPPDPDDEEILPNREMVTGEQYTAILILAEEIAERENVPSEVSPAQAEIALYNAGLLNTVNALLDTYPYEPVKIWWRKATYISRNHPYLEAVAIELELSDETVDALFKAAVLL